MIKKIFQKIKSKIESNLKNRIMKADIKDLGFTCCFCNEGIYSSDPNPAELTIIAGVDKSKDEQMEQFFWCHGQCFEDKLHETLQ